MRSVVTQQPLIEEKQYPKLQLSTQTSNILLMRDKYNGTLVHSPTEGWEIGDLFQFSKYNVGCLKDTNGKVELSND